jgi:hypothetical protein
MEDRDPPSVADDERRVREDDDQAVLDALVRQAAADDAMRSKPLQSKAPDVSLPPWLTEFDARQTLGDVSITAREFIDENLRLIRTTNTIITGAAILFVISRSRAFKRATSAQDFRNELFVKRHTISGRVIGVHGNHLLVQHEPWLRRLLRVFSPFHTSTGIVQPAVTTSALRRKCCVTGVRTSWFISVSIFIFVFGWLMLRCEPHAQPVLHFRRNY